MAHPGKNPSLLTPSIQIAVVQSALPLGFFSSTIFFFRAAKSRSFPRYSYVRRSPWLVAVKAHTAKSRHRCYELFSLPTTPGSRYRKRWQQHIGSRNHPEDRCGISFSYSLGASPPTSTIRQPKTTLSKDAGTAPTPDGR